ncbi:uncharacterized protein LOC129570652 [Sitodiplosis mosellana]|uniref:uncharacterized protein LOC129570652 n=1 Tax=Sitodiplosis mosellana TaxID=263140 RepID=UPI00244492ED|nr:uncharacterized protein LOC129570652 [Sitodiplosis mosellana]
MNTRRMTASRKRQQEETNTPANKRFKSSGVVAADVKAITDKRSSNKMVHQPTKIYYTRLRRRNEEEEKQQKLTDVNTDCLEQIFKRLSLTDLLNVADSNQQLKPAVDLAFRSQFGKRSIKIDMERKIVGFSEKVTDSLTAEIPWSFRFKLLRCFGHLIAKLKITYVREPSQEDSKRAAHIDRYVNEYCAKSLVEIEFNFCQASTLDNLKKPFSTVETLCFVDCRLERKLSELNKWFPKVRCLELLCVKEILDCDETAVHFPDLEHLTLILLFNEKKYFLELLRLNPHLRILFIGGNIDVQCLQSVSEHLQHLETLAICALKHGNISNIGNDTVHFPNVKNLLLRGVVLQQFPLTFDKLEYLDIKSIAMDQTLANFISKHKKLIMLDYSGNKYGEKGSLLKVASPALVKVDFGHSAFPLDEVVTYMKKCTSLKKLSLGFDNEKDYKAVQNRLGKEWRGTNMKSIDDAIAVTMERQSI